MVIMGLGPSFLRFLLLRLEALEFGDAGASFWLLWASTSLPLIAADGVAATGKEEGRASGEAEGKMDEMRGQGLA